MDFTDELVTAIREELGKYSVPVDVLAGRLHEREDLASLRKFTTDELADVIRGELVLASDDF
jgi:hypothetical protein